MTGPEILQLLLYVLALVLILVGGAFGQNHPKVSLAWLGVAVALAAFVFVPLFARA